MRTLHWPSGWKMTRLGANGNSGNITGPAARPSQASSSSGLNDEDRKQTLEPSQHREAKIGKVEREASTLKRKREDGREEDKDDSRQRRDVVTRP